MNFQLIVEKISPFYGHAIRSFVAFFLLWITYRILIRIIKKRWGDTENAYKWRKVLIDFAYPTQRFYNNPTEGKVKSIPRD